MFKLNQVVSIHPSSPYFNRDLVSRHGANPRFTRGVIRQFNEKHTHNFIHVEWDNGEWNTYNPCDLMLNPRTKSEFTKPHKMGKGSTAVAIRLSVFIHIKHHMNFSHDIFSTEYCNVRRKIVRLKSGSTHSKIMNIISGYAPSEKNLWN